MKLKVVIVIALFATVMVFAQGPTSPVVTGGFAQTGPSATLILLNDSSLDDVTLANIALALNLRTANVAVATRLAGSSYCGPGEWCLLVSDTLRGSSVEATGALVGTAVTKEIGRKMLQ